MEQPPFIILATGVQFVPLVLLFSSSCLQPDILKLDNNFTSLESLFAFKDHAADPHGILATNWINNTSFCCWIGISCSRCHRQLVAAAAFPSTGLSFRT